MGLKSQAGSKSLVDQSDTVKCIPSCVVISLADDFW